MVNEEEINKNISKITKTFLKFIRKFKRNSRK